jgi:hypothetical protein
MLWLFLLFFRDVFFNLRIIMIAQPFDVILNASLHAPFTVQTDIAVAVSAIARLYDVKG